MKKIRTASVAALIVLGAIALVAYGGDEEGGEPSGVDGFDDEPGSDSFPEDDFFAEETPEDVEAPRAPRVFAPGGGAPDRRAQRRDRLARRIDITALGPVEPTVTPRQMLRAIRAIRPDVRACVQEGGGREALRASLGTHPSGRPERRITRFDVGADGRVDRSTLSFTPPLPESMDECWRATFDGLTLPDVGDGARVELRFGGGRGPRRGDAGAPMRPYR